ncbi:hypothetical protein HYFRA_00005198 [Hymenoscyphus fraxineus]|uniref:Uncharacterized protein n=1 Tax=Hymenoscyphus fraxineus TaxID=746836 RepID=A0A9N9Q1W4_9HELO|nr:hypothetical protein HYFRA_00005198 [Hymenoscyphus fraxineus]
MERILDNNDDALEVSATDFSLFKRRFFTYYPKLIGKFESYESLINMDHNSVESTKSLVEPAELPACESVKSTTELPSQQTDQLYPIESTPICTDSTKSPISVEVPESPVESPQLPACEPTELPIQQTDQPCPIESTPICTVSAESPISIKAPKATTADESLQLACLPAESPQLSAYEYAKSPVPAESPQSLRLATVATALFWGEEE